MIATITHELKNPLTAIRGYAEMLSAQGLGGRAVEAIERNVVRLVTLADDLLLLAKVSDPHRELVPAPVPLAPLVAEVCEAIGVQAQLAQVRLDCDEVPQDATAVGERDELLRMLVNIVGNAVKYTPAGGRVLLSVTGDQDMVAVRCADTGLGIRPEDLERLFDEFDRSSNPLAQARPGSGLGLAIVKRIVDRHGGQLHVESELQVGSTFTVHLPRA
jgi:signal transduction histidine kinase